MEDFYTNITSLNNSYDYSNFTYDYYDYSNMTFDLSNILADIEYSTKLEFIWFVLTCVIIGVGLSSTLIAIYCLYSQLCCMIVEVASTGDLNITEISMSIYQSALLVSVVLIVSIALERYLIIACPLWYRYRRTIKISVVVCVLVWTFAPVPALIFVFWLHSYIVYIIFSVIFLLPLPLFIFFLGGTLKALSASISVPSDEKRRIVAVLVLVLLIYTLLFLPAIIFFLLVATSYYLNFTHYILYEILLRLSPLADLTLYVFMRKGIIDKLLSSVCCCRMDRMDSDDTNSPSV